MALGGETFNSTRFELVNTGRAKAYVEGWNAKIKAARLDPDSPALTGCIDWLHGCDGCEASDQFWSDGAGYLFPETDTAPWYDPQIKDSERFLGVIGLEVKGDEDSTRSAEVTQSIGGGGVVGRLRYAPRTFVVRALAVAVDGCGMEVGLNWLREQYNGVADSCEGDYLWVLDCCPSCIPDPDAPTTGPCWADTYAELIGGSGSAAAAGIDAGTASSTFLLGLDGGAAGSTYLTGIDAGTASSTFLSEGGTGVAPDDCPPGIWWPTTYAELRDGPPSLNPAISGWCAWVQLYRELRTGLPEFSCSVGECIDPYVRNYRNVRVVEGPTVLTRRTMSTVGEIAEIEFTIVAADPAEYSPYVYLAALAVTPTMMLSDTPPMMMAAAGPVTDPFARGRTVRVQRRTRLMEMPTEWERHEFSVDPVRTTKMVKFVPRFTLSAVDAESGPVRVGLWREGELVDGFTVPFIPEGGTVQIDGRERRTVTEHNGYVQTRNGFAVGFDGGVHSWPEVAFGATGLRVSVDQEVGKTVQLVAQVEMSEKGSA